MSLDFNDFKDYQKNPFTKITYYTSVTNESHVVTNQLGGYMVKLYHAPRETAPSTVVITIGGTPLKEVPSTVTPANMQFRVWYDEDGLGWVDFNANQDGLTALCSYEHYGTMHSKDSITSAFQIKEIIYDSASWVNAITRVSANVYKFRDDITNIEFRYLVGGYLISDILSDGDTWGKIQTNVCSNIYFQSGAYIYVGDTQSYIEVNTAKAKIENAGIKGANVSAVALTYSFLTNADEVEYYGCWVSHRKTNNAFSGFYGSGATTVFVGCKVSYCTGTEMNAFSGCYNVSNAIISNNTLTTMIVFKSSNTISNCIIRSNTVTTLRIFSSSNNIDNIGIFSNTTSDTYYIAYTCNNINNIYDSSDVMNNAAAGFAGFYQCNNISNIYIDSFQSSGSFTAINSSMCVDNVRVTNSIATVFRIAYLSTKINKIYSGANTANSASSSYGIDTCVGVSLCDITAPNSGAGAGYGYSGCNRVYGCTGTAKTALFSTSYFSSDNSVACAAGNGNA